MLTVSFTADLAILYFVAVNVIAILVFVLIMKHRARVTTRNQAAVSAAIIEYFRHSGAEVSVDCISRLGGKRFIAVIDSEPLKRFRYSHIVEVCLCSYVSKVCGLKLEKVYWRFPVKLPAEAPSIGEAAHETLENEDEYINTRLLRLKANAEYKVTPASWEQFEAALQDESERKLY